MASRAEVDALLAETYPALLASDYPQDVLEQVLPKMTKAQDKLLSSGTYILVRDAGGLAVAAGGWTPYAPGPDGAVTPGLGHIRHVVTRLGRTGEGIGRALMDHLTRDARSQEMKELETISTLTAVPFYAAVGFHAEEEFNVNIGGVPFASVRMRRKI